MHSLLTAVLFFTAAVVEPTPAVMVLQVEGDVAVLPAGGRPRGTATVMDLLYPEDQIIAAPGSAAILVFLRDGHRERIQASRCVVITCDGGTPACVIASHRAVVSAIVAEGKDIRPLARSGRGAAVVFR